MSEGIMFFGLVALVSLDWYCRANWTRLYFRSGVLCYRRRLHLKRNITLGALDADLTRRLRSDIPPGTEFKKLSENELAFRQQGWESRWLTPPYTPVMHGHAEALPSEPVVIVSGRLNWWALAMLSLGLYFLCSEIFGSFMWLWGLLAFCILGISYLLQLGHFEKVTDELFSYLKH